MTETPDTLTRAWATVGSAISAAGRFLTKTDNGVLSYVASGHEAITEIDAAMQLLYQARTEMVTVIRRDEDERIIRVDALLAKCAADRATRAKVAPVEMEHASRVRVASEDASGAAVSWIAECGPCGWVSRNEFRDRDAARAEAEQHTASPKPVAGQSKRVTDERLDEICLALEALDADPESGETDARSDYIVALPELDHDRTAVVDPDERLGTLHLLDGSRIIPSRTGWEWER